MVTIDVLSSAACLMLTGTFALAAVAKARRPLATAASFGALGLPCPSILARLVPLGEAVTATMILVLPRTGALVALGLLAAFTLVLTAPRRGSAGVRCACFGAASSAPVTGVTFLRNALLGTGALIAIPADTVDISIPAVLSAVALVLLGASVLALADITRTTGGLFRPQPTPINGATR